MLYLPRSCIGAIVLWLLASSGTEVARTAAGPAPLAISNIAAFLETCPSTDPAYEQIRTDLKIRQNGRLVGDVPCTEPISAMPIDRYTDELIALQGFRVMYHMDAGKGDYLPWAKGRVYDWLVSKVQGVNINDEAKQNSCCSVIGGQRHITLIRADAVNRNFDRTWFGISGNITLYLHEARHVDGFPHTSCCVIPGGCDQRYDEKNLSPYGLSFWMSRAWAEGTIDVGVGCSSPRDAQTALMDSWSSANSLRTRFCENAPPEPPLPDASRLRCQ